MNPGMMMNRPIMFQQPQMQQKPEEAKLEEAKSSEPEANPISQASSNMVEVLQNSTNPKHRNSEFLKFLNKLNMGAIKIEDDQLVEDAVKMTEFEKQESIRMEKEIIRQQEEEQFRKEHEAHLAKIREEDDLDEIKDGEEQTNIFGDGEEELTEEKFDQMMNMWKQEGANMMSKDMMEEWNKVWEEEAQMKGFGPVNPTEIQFQKENKFKDENDLMAKARALIDQGKIQEAILCLEAEV